MTHANLAQKIVGVNQSAVQLAKEVTHDKNVLLAGSLGPTGEMMQPFGSMSVEQVFDIYAENTTKPIWFKPNAGLPTSNPDGSTSYDVTPEMMGAQVPGWIAAGARLVGSCCGTSPEHLATIANMVKGK